MLGVLEAMLRSARMGATSSVQSLGKLRTPIILGGKIKDTHNFRRADFIDRHNDYTRLIHNKRTL